MRHCAAFKVSGGMVRVVTPGARLFPCFQHPAHLSCVKTRQVVSSLEKEQEAVNNVITLASRSAAPTTPTTGTPDPIQLHAAAHNALAMALHYLRQPQANVPGAARKAVQALAALRSLGNADVCTSPSTQGGAA